MKKVKSLSAVLLCILMMLFFTFGFAEENQITPRYSYTSFITAGLDINGSTAACSGTVTPSGSYSASVTVTLYRQNGSSWVYIDSWSGSATGGASACAGGSATITSGTYKVVTRGNIGGGLEYPTKTITRTK